MNRRLHIAVAYHTYFLHRADGTAVNSPSLSPCKWHKEVRSTMRAVVVTEPEKTALGELPDSQAGLVEVVFKLMSCGLCGTDIHILGGELPMARRRLVPGYELAGEIVALGEGVTGLTVGTRVSAEPNMARGARHYCGIGRGNLCDDASAVGVTPERCFAKLVAAPARSCHCSNGARCANTGPTARGRARNGPVPARLRTVLCSATIRLRSLAWRDADGDAGTNGHSPSCDEAV
ncbi:alcohol dehydrogenase catalytic domain-containing protein [Streptomyces sp. NPDC050636]|uniref:alcohol dehydrogenase catalytic domain-containing protein n=1 Tax=Streptomyces sp. NPDC050636 TaxID=3154510 RepID=UPI003441A467